MLIRLEEKEESDEYRQKVYAGTCTSHMSELVHHLIGYVSRIVQMSEPEEIENPLEITESAIDIRKEQKLLC